MYEERLKSSLATASLSVSGGGQECKGVRAPLLCFPDSRVEGVRTTRQVWNQHLANKWEFVLSARLAETQSYQGRSAAQCTISNISNPQVLEGTLQVKLLGVSELAELLKSLGKFGCKKNALTCPSRLFICFPVYMCGLCVYAYLHVCEG